MDSGSQRERARRCRAVGVRVCDQVRMSGQFEALNERAALANGFLEFQRANDGKFGRHLLHHPQRIVGAAVQHHDHLELARIVAREERCVVAQHGFDAALLVIGRDEQQQAWVRHADSLAESTSASNLADTVGKLKFPQSPNLE